MPQITTSEGQKILDAIAGLRGAERTAAQALADKITPKGIASVLHAMRRWYGYNTGSVARRILEHREALKAAMNLKAPIGVYRGFKVDVNSPLLDGLKEGDIITLPVDRNDHCSSWTAERDLANRFSGSPKGKVGIVIQLVDGRDVETFIAPPSKSKPWFNRLYEKTMGRSFRFNEQEYALQASSVRVKIIAIKRK